MIRNSLISWIRKLGWMHYVDGLYFRIRQFRSRQKNEAFKKQHPEIALPPDYMLYEAYRLSYSDYYYDGKNTAAELAEQLSAFITPGGAILEWGCGPARVVRHLPSLLPGIRVFGTDYNPHTIAWCRQHIRDVQFDLNALAPPLNYADGFFDAVYALSVFTHLSGPNHYLWMDELHRILKPGGALLITTQGKAFLPKLSAAEKERFSSDELVVRNSLKEGHRLFSAFQPERFMQTVFSNRWKVLKFAPGSIQNWGPEQDTWIVQKTES